MNSTVVDVALQRARTMDKKVVDRLDNDTDKSAASKMVTTQDLESEGRLKKPTTPATPPLPTLPTYECEGLEDNTLPKMRTVGYEDEDHEEPNSQISRTATSAATISPLKRKIGADDSPSNTGIAMHGSEPLPSTSKNRIRWSSVEAGVPWSKTGPDANLAPVGSGFKGIAKRMSKGTTGSDFTSKPTQPNWDDDEESDGDGMASSPGKKWHCG